MILEEDEKERKTIKEFKEGQNSFRESYNYLMSGLPKFEN